MKLSKLLRIGIAIVLIDAVLVALIVFFEIRILKQEAAENKVQETQATKLEQIYTPEGTKIRAKAISEYARNQFTSEDEEWI